MTSCRVLIDGYFLGRPYGFGRFTAELCRALGHAQADMEFIVAVPQDADATLQAEYPNLRWRRLPNPNRIAWEQVLIPRLARTLACDVIHFPCNTTAAFTFGIPTVTTVHDIIFLSNRAPLTQFKAWVSTNYIKFVFRNFTTRSTAIISVSNTTRSSLADLGVESTTIYNTVSGLAGNRRVEDDRSSTRPYILHRGGTSEHRNTGRVIDAFRAAQASLPGVDLKILGVNNGPELWRTQGDPTIQFLPRVSDDELAALYARSGCVVVTSLMEGFGLPIIEAFSFGAPVITSNIDPMMEIAGGAAVLVDPRSVPDISKAMMSVISDSALAGSLTTMGYGRMEAFDSSKVAQQTIEIYRKTSGAGRAPPPDALTAG